ncbi:MAG: hypothetical protein OES69_02415 [Myxococcales bacterium]|nr:hypothetical protein [Myxococcales bacterium]
MTPDELDRHFVETSRMLSSALNRFEGIRVEMLDRITAPSPSDGQGGASEDVKMRLRAIEDQIAVAQRSLIKGERHYADSALATAQVIIGMFRKEVGDPRPFDMSSPPIPPPAPSPGSYSRPIEALPEHMPDLPDSSGPLVPGELAVVVAVPSVGNLLHRDLHDAPQHVGQLVGAYISGDDAAKSRILNTPVAEGGPYSSEQFERWRKALQEPTEHVDRGSWSDKSGDKPEAVGPNE